MNINKIDDIRLFISLTNEDMQAFDLRFDQFLWSDRKSRNVIRDLLLMAEEKTGFSAENRRLMIEVIPRGDGCAILFTLLSDKVKTSRKKFRIKNKYDPFLYEFETSSDLLDAIAKLGSIKTNIKESSLIENKNKYYLIVYTNTGLTTVGSIVLTEYGKLKGYGKILESNFLEHGKIIVEKRAIEKLGKHLTN